MATIVGLSLVVLVAVSSAAGNGNCVGKCFPGKFQQGKLGVMVSNLFANLGEPSGLDLFSYFAYDPAGMRFYTQSTHFNDRDEKCQFEVLQLYKEVTAPPPVSVCHGSVLTRCISESSRAVCCHQQDGLQDGRTRDGPSGMRSTYVTVPLLAFLEHSAYVTDSVVPR